MKPILDQNGKEPIHNAVETLRRSNDPVVKRYGERLSKLLSDAKSLFDQLMSVIKVMIGYHQEENHRGQGTEKGRKAFRSSKDIIMKNRTAMEQAIEASTLVMPRNKGPHPQMMSDTSMLNAAKENMTAVDEYITAGKGMRATTKKYEAVSGEFKEEQILKYLGRVMPPPKQKP
jgi:hypothetical protein